MSLIGYNFLKLVILDSPFMAAISYKKLLFYRNPNNSRTREIMTVAKKSVTHTKNKP